MISPSFTFGQFILIMPIMDERETFPVLERKMLQLLTASHLPAEWNPGAGSVFGELSRNITAGVCSGIGGVMVKCWG